MYTKSPKGNAGVRGAFPGSFTDANDAGLFGYIAQSGEQITKIVLGGAGTSYDNRNHFVDDFGFAPVPEPSALVLGGLGLAVLVRQLRIRARKVDCRMKM